MNFKGLAAWNELRADILQRALVTGDFTLSSGAKSTYYLDSKQLQTPRCLELMTSIITDVADAVAPDAIGGPETGAIFITSAVLTFGAVFRSSRFQSVEGFYIRKQAKKHGTQALIDGRVAKGDRVVMLDDVLTTGNSLLAAIREVEAVGAEVVRVICLVDRQQGGKEALKGYDLISLFDICDLLAPGLSVNKK